MLWKLIMTMVFFVVKTWALVAEAIILVSGRLWSFGGPQDMNTDIGSSSGEQAAFRRVYPGFQIREGPKSTGEGAGWAAVKPFGA